MSRSRRHSPWIWYHSNAEWEDLGNRCFRRRNRQVLHVADYDDTPEFHDMRTLGPYRNYDPDLYAIEYRDNDHRRCFWRGPCSGQYGFRGFYTCPALDERDDCYQKWLRKAWRK